MDLITVIKTRFSAREYKNRPVEREKIIKILNAARFAPSAVNFQPWLFIVLQEPENLSKIQLIYTREWIKNAPVIIIACADHSKSWKRKTDGKDSADIDVAIAIDHMTLQATELGLGTCWVCNFDAKQCSRLFNLPDHIEPVALLPVGYFAKAGSDKKRKQIDEIVFWEKYSV